MTNKQTYYFANVIRVILKCSDSRPIKPLSSLIKSDAGSELGPDQLVSGPGLHTPQLEMFTNWFTTCFSNPVRDPACGQGLIMSNS